METKTIPGYPKYTISTDGTITSYWFKTPRVMKQCLSKDGYLRLNLTSEADGQKKKKNHKVHRLLAETFLSTWDPTLQVDHIDRDKTNNSLSNLRMVEQSFNVKNVNGKGCSFVKDKNPKKPWRATIQTDGKQKSLGFFATQEEARAAYVAAKLKYHGVVLDS